MAPQTLAVDSSNLHIPLIDFSQFLQGSPSARLEAARQILTGFQTAGFIYLSNLPIPSSDIQNAFAASAEFFKRPLEEKDALAWSTPAANRGYSTMGREKVTSITDKNDVQALKAQVPDIKESLEIGRENERDHPNHWPAGDEAFKSTMRAFFGQCKELHVQVMRAIAVGMGIDEGWFDGFTDVGDNTLRLLHYPRVEKSVFVRNKMQVRAGAHTDYGSITLLFQDARGGLQVQSPDGAFVDATPIEGTVVVNAGDLLARWSNDTIRSTVHRVVEPPKKVEDGEVYPSRYSIAYFCNPNFGSFIEAIPGTFKEEEERKYNGINSGDYIVGRLEATY